MFYSGFATAADRYWVGGNANWDGVVGTKWSATPGGPGGASIPTAADNAIFDGASGAVTVTISAGNTGCLTLDASTFTGTVAGAAAINITGGLYLGNAITRTYTGAITFNSTTGTQTITMTDNTLASAITFNGVGGTWQLADNLTTTGAVTLTNGTIDANNQNFTMLTFSSSNANARTITMGTGTWTLTGNNATIWTTATSTNLTLNRGNAVVSNYAGAVGTRTITGGTTEAVSVDFNITGGTDSVALNSGARTMNFTGFSGTLTNVARTLYGGWTLSAGMTLTAGVNATTFAATTGPYTLTSNGKTTDFPLTFNGVGGSWQLGDAAIVGATRTVTLTNGTFNANNQNFTMGIFSSSNANTRTITMGSGTWTLTNTGAVTIWDTTTITNLTINANTALIDLTGVTASTRTINGGTAQIASIRVSAGTGGITTTNVNCNDLTFAAGYSGAWGSANITIRGSLSLSAGMTVTAGATTLTFTATTGPKTITSNGKTIDRAITFNGAGGSWQLVDALLMGSTRTLTLTAGTFDANGQNVTVGLFSSSNANVRTITMGAGTWTLTGNNTTIWTTSTSTNLTLNRGNPLVSNYAGAVGTRTLTGGSTEAVAVDLDMSFGAGSVALSGGWRDVDFTGFSGTLTNTTRTIYGSLTIVAAMTETAGANATTFAATSGTHTITTNSETLDFPLTFSGVGGTWQLGDNLTMGSTRTLTLTSGTFNANNFNVSVGLFASSGAVARTLTMGSGTWTLTGNNTTIWTTATSTNLTLNRGNAVVANYAGAVGTRTITGGSTEAVSVDFNITGGTDIIALNTGARTVNFTGFAGTMSNLTRTLYGGVTFSAGMTLTAGALVTTFTATTGPYTITTNAKTLDFPVTFTGVGGSWQFGDNVTVGSTRTVTLTNGTLNANGFNFSMGRFSSSNANARTITMGAGTWTLTGNNATIWTTSTSTNLTLNRGNPIVSNYALAVGTRTIIGSANEARSPDFNITAGTDILDITAGTRHLNFTGFAGSLNLDTRTIYGSLTLAAGMTLTAGANVTTFAGTTGPYTITSNGKTIDFPITFNGTGGTWQLGDSMLVGSTRTVTLTSGTFNANGVNMTMGFFSSTGAVARTITMGAGTWTLTGNNGTIWTTAVSTNLTLNRGNPIICNYALGVGTRTITGSTTSAASPDISVTAGTDIVALSGGVRHLDMTGFAGTFSNLTRSIYGSLTLSVGMSLSAGANITTFAATSGTSTITSNGKTMDFPLTFNGVGGTWQLVDALTSGSTRTMTLTNGTFDANNQNVSTGLFSSSNANTRTITMGSGTWTLSGVGTIWDTSTSTSLTVNANTSTINATDATAGARVMTANSVVLNHLDVSAGSGAMTLTNMNVNDLDWTGYSGAWSDGALTVRGNLTLSATMTSASGSGILTFAATTGPKTIDMNGVQFNRPVTFNGVGGSWQLLDDLNMDGVTEQTLTLTNGSIDANGFDVTAGQVVSSNSNIRSLTMGSGIWTLTGTGTIWDFATTTNLTLAGGTSSLVANDASGLARVLTGNSASINHLAVTAGTGTVTLTDMNVNDLDWTGFNGTWNDGALTVRGSATLDVGMSVSSGASTLTFAATSGPETINMNGLQFNRPVIFSGVGGSWQLLSDLNMSGASLRTLTLTNGDLDANGFDVTAGVFSSSNANNRVLSMGEGTWTMMGTGTVWDLSTSTNMTLNSETSAIVINDASASSKTFAGGGQTYNFLQLTGAGSGSFDITGSNTFTNFVLDTPPHTLRFTAGTTTTFTNGPTLSGTAGNLNVLNSITAAQHTLSYSGVGTLSYQYLDVNYSNATPASTWYCDDTCINGGFNTGWVFPSTFSPKVIFF